MVHGNDTNVSYRPRRFDRSDLIAVIALVISVLGAGASLWQNRILTRQLELSVAQRDAAAWPHLDVSHSYTVDSTHLIYELKINNEGVGPALLGDARLLYAGKPFDPSDYAETVAEGRAGFQQVWSTSLGGGVYPAGESVLIANVRFPRELLSFEEVMAIVDDVEIDLCYCSVYGECWSFRDEGWPESISECVGVDR